MDAREINELEMMAVYSSPTWAPSDRMLRHFQSNNTLIIDDGPFFWDTVDN